MTKRNPKEQPPYKVNVRLVDVDPEERERRLNRALDILIDESLPAKRRKKRGS